MRQRGVEVLLFGLPDAPLCSGEAGNERAQLREDAVQRAGDDADNRGEEAADNRKT